MYGIKKKKVEVESADLGGVRKARRGNMIKMHSVYYEVLKKCTYAREER